MAWEIANSPEEYFRIIDTWTSPPLLEAYAMQRVHQYMTENMPK